MITAASEAEHTFSPNIHVCLKQVKTVDDRVPSFMLEVQVLHPHAPLPIRRVIGQGYRLSTYSLGTLSTSHFSIFFSETCSCLLQASYEDYLIFSIFNIR